GFYDIQKWNYWNTDKFQRGYTLLIGATVGYQMSFNNRWGLDIFITGANSQGGYHGYKILDDNSIIRYDSATHFNRSGEWLISKAGIMLTYKLKTKNYNKKAQQ
ncbi:MAG TPA: DUF3575 domain-containing protein, partial [Faecalibacter sp.]